MFKFYILNKKIQTYDKERMFAVSEVFNWRCLEKQFKQTFAL